jgi:ligand-binding sensor domain-containing protein/signal transduction histidine kinase
MIPHYHIKLIFLLIIFSISSFSAADFKFDHLLIEDGISQSTIFDIHQDSEGFLWFATQDGLNRYDGYNFKIYYHDKENSNTISDNYIQCIHEDGHGNLWIGTAGGGLNRLNRKTGEFGVYKFNEEYHNSLSSNYINTILVDISGMIWVGTAGGGLNMLDPYTGEIKHYLTRQEGYCGEVSSLHQDRNGQLWIGTQERLFTYDKVENKFNNYSQYLLGSTKRNIAEIIESEDGNIWIGVDGYGIVRFNPQTHAQRHFRTFMPAASLGLNNIRITSIFELDNRTMLFGTFGGGLYIFDRISETVKQYKSNVKDESSLSNNHVLEIFQDHAQILWIGTLKGINKIDLKPAKFKHFKIDSNTPDISILNLSDINFVTSIILDNEANIWYGTFGAGLFRYNRITNKINSYYDQGQSVQGLKGNEVWALHLDSRKKLWIGTSVGLNEFDISTSQFQLHRIKQVTQPLDLSNSIRAIIPDKNGNLWIGSNGAGLHYFDPYINKFTAYTQPLDNKFGKFLNSILCLYRDQEEMIWIGTNGAGLCMFNPKTKSMHHYQYSNDSSRGVSSYRINVIKADRFGNLWLGTSNGLSILDRGEKRFKHYTESQGLANSFIYAIEQDENGNMWLSSNKGLVHATMAEDGQLTFRNYDAEDGLQSNEFNTNCSYKSSTGELFFGGINGFNNFYPDQVKDNFMVPKISVTSFRIRDGVQNYNPSKTLVQLNYDENSIAFEFSALDFSNPLKNQYAYKLEGFEDNWIYSGNRRYVSYTNLQPGDYVFRVKGSNNDAIWNEEGTWVRLSITPPFWKTLWAYVIYLVIVVSTIVGVIRFRSSKLEKDKKRLESKVSEKTEQLQLSYEKLKVTQKEAIQSAKLKAMGKLASGMAHDFNNILTIILGSAQLLKANLTREKELKLATNIETAALDGTEVIRKIQDFSRNDAETSTSLVDINKILTDVIEVTRFKWIDQKQLQDITIKFETDFAVIPEIRVKASEIRLIFTNIIINAIEAFEKSGNIKVKTCIENQEWITILIIDQGKGMDRETLSHIFDPFYSTKGEEGYGLGLSQVYGIINRLKGKIMAKSEPGRGTEMAIKLPLSLAPERDESEVSDATTLLDAIQGKRILIVEDEAIIRELYEDVLSREGYELAMAGSGEQGLEAWSKKNYDLIICDLGLPGMSGWEFIRTIRDDNNEIPIIALTGWGDMISSEKAEAYHVNKVVSKPVKLTHLLNYIHELIIFKQ